MCRYNVVMVRKKATSQNVGLGDRIIQSVHAWRRMSRLLFPSPAEVAFVLLMGGSKVTVPFISSKRTGFPLTFLNIGRILKGELIEREVMAGGPRRYCMDFATPKAAYRKAIEIDGSQHDIVYDQQRDEYLRALGWSVMRIPARRLSRDPLGVRQDVLRFLRA